MNKNHSFRSALHFCSAPKSLQIFSRASFPASKITPIKLIKKGLLQYSSSSRIKDSAPIQFKFTLNGKKGERPNNSRREADAGVNHHTITYLVSLQNTYTET